MNEILRVSVSQLDGTAYVGCAGEIDILTAPKVEEAVELALECRPEMLRLNLLEVSLLSSHGVEVLIGTFERCRQEMVQLTIIAGRRAQKTLDILGCTWLLQGERPLVDAGRRG